MGKTWDLSNVLPSLPDALPSHHASQDRSSTYKKKRYPQDHSRCTIELANLKDAQNIFLGFGCAQGTEQILDACNLHQGTCNPLWNWLNCQEAHGAARQMQPLKWQQRRMSWSVCKHAWPNLLQELLWHTLLASHYKLAAAGADDASDLCVGGTAAPCAWSDANNKHLNRLCSVQSCIQFADMLCI